MRREHRALGDLRALDVPPEVTLFHLALAHGEARRGREADYELVDDRPPRIRLALEHRVDREH